MSKQGQAIMNRARKGLYAGVHIGFGNTISHSGTKVRRSWKPNVQTKKYYSELLGEELKLRVTTRAMRTIDKYFGLDNYLLQSRPTKLGEGLPLELRARVQEALQAKLAKEQASQKATEESLTKRV